MISGATGAALEPRVGLILGLANLVADGVSMGASNYLGLRSELEQTGADVRAEMPWRHGLATLVAFVVAGSAPLLAYVMPRPAGVSLLVPACALAVLTLMAAGALRGRLVGKPAPQSAAEVVAVGAAAAAAAYAIGALVSGLVR